MAGIPSEAQIQKRLQAVIKDDRGLDTWSTVAFRAPSGWTGKDRLEVNQLPFLVREARSVLEFRSHLVEAEQQGARLVVLTQLPESELGDDVMAVLYKNRLETLNPWQSLAEEFGATDVDPRLTESRDVAEALLANRPPEGFPHVPTRLLDQNTAWKEVVRHVLGLPSGTPSAEELLLALEKPQARNFLPGVDRRIIDQACHWLADQGLGTSAALIQLAATGKGAEALALGLVAQVVFHKSAEEVKDLLQAQVRFEQYTGLGTLPSQVLMHWKTAALATLERLDEQARQRHQDRGDALLKEFRAEGHAHLSGVSPSGLEQLVSRFAATLRAHLDGASPDPRELLSALKEIQDHRLSTIHGERTRRLEMAVRLVRWLREDSEEESRTDLAKACRRYAEVLAYVDWARESLVAGDVEPGLQQVYRDISDRALTRREAFNRLFGGKVADWSGDGQELPGVLMIEDVLKNVVARAVSPRVLVIVLDGMSWRVAHELLADIERRYGWYIVARKDVLEGLTPVLTTVPSITEFGRTSLLSGKLSVGNADDEKAAFATHPALRALASTNQPPILFHRADLDAPGRQGLGEALLRALSDPGRKVVGVVINAVDDHLLKGDQLPASWEVDRILPLEALLLQAKASGRLVVIASDHGHVLDRQTVQAAGTTEGGERWQPAYRKPLEGEVRVSGTRVAPFAKDLLVPWSESVRYVGRKNGYHGGVSPQEMVAPCVTLAHVSAGLQEPQGWTGIARPCPPWWELRIEGLGSSEPGPPKPRPAKPARKEQGVLFDATPTWIERLLASEAYHESERRVGRAVPSRDDVRRCLEALDTADGCRLPSSVLAARLQKPELRIRGFITQMQRLLNLEGFQAIAYTPDGAFVSLDRSLLFRQFQVGEPE